MKKIIDKQVKRDIPLRREIGSVLQKAVKYGLKKGVFREEIELKDSITGYSRWIDEIIDIFLSTAIKEAVEEMMDEIVEKKFPIGERQWCVKCANRIKKQVIKIVSKEK